MTTKTTSLEQAYTALRDAAVVRPLPTAGVLQLTGADRVDFLQRMTTNDIGALQRGTACVTVLTSPTAKILHVFSVVAHDDHLLLLPAPGAAASLARSLRGQIFFMDQVQVTDLSQEYTQLRVMGPAAGSALAGAGFIEDGMGDSTWHEAEGVIVVRQEVYDVPGYAVVVPVPERDSILARLALPVLDDEDAYTARRVELGRPAPGAELTGEYNPLEAGLAWSCAENKGCYTGQEIIARQVTYDKVTRTLVGLRSEQPMAAGATVTVDGRGVGAVTSVAFSPALQQPIALAILKRPHNTPGTAVLAGEIAAEVSSLPLAA